MFLDGCCKYVCVLFVSYEREILFLWMVNYMEYGFLWVGKCKGSLVLFVLLDVFVRDELNWVSERRDRVLGWGFFVVGCVIMVV